MSKLRLYHYWRSSSSWRVRWALAIKNIEWEGIAVNLLEGEQAAAPHLARNPFASVPVLEIAQGKFLSESLAIIEWLDETQPGTKILPNDPWQRALSRQMAEIINAGTQPLQNLNVQKYVTSDLQDKDAAKAKWTRHWTLRGLAAYEKVATQSAGKFSVGDTISLADLCLIPQIYNASRNQIGLENFPILDRIWKNANAEESFRKSHPERYQPQID